MRALILLMPTVMLTVVTALANQGGSWDPLGALVQARQETGAARIGGTVYVVGGLMPNFPFQANDTVEAYDIAADSWSVVTSLPGGPLDHMGVASVDGRLYVMGGFAGDFDARDETWIYDPAADAWSAGAKLPAPRGACWAVAHGGRIYLFGGENAAGGSTSSTFIYDPGLDSWSVGAPFGVAREHLVAAAAGDFIYVIGGRSGAATAVNERYDPATDSWATMTPMPTARSAMAVGSLGGRLYVAGGEVPQLFATHEVYDVATDSWSCAAPMPVPRHGAAAVTLFDRILVPAGGLIQGLAPTTWVDSFVPERHPWENPGGGLSGVAGVPYLSCFGSLLGSSPLEFRLEDGRPLATAFFVLSLVAVNLPFKGGTLVPAPDVIVPLPLDADGALAFTTTWPPGIPAGATIVVQYWIPDPAGVFGFAASNGAIGTTP